MNTPEQVTQLDAIEADALARIGAAAGSDELDAIRVDVLGKKGSLKAILKSLGQLDPNLRSLVGARANEAKERVEAALDEARQRSATASSGRASVDVTLPGRRPEIGARHPISHMTRRMIEVFRNLGFRVAAGPEVEDEWHNFSGLNIPPDHIARDPSENFYLTDDLLLRSQTSTVQIRVMEENQPPLRVIAPGKVYRPDTVDASHSYMFHQLEGLMVDEGVTFRDLKATLLLFFRQMYHDTVKLRLRPSFFPFTEPSAEIDLSCPFCRGEGCRVCKQTGWMEVGGCGMVDPNVFDAVGYDPEKYTGFAFGMGIDRLTMVRYDIPDIRALFENDIRFLDQFSI
ncbi:MAG: phenylalanine--tRNA ligase subunit alpha [Planctomycetota bacterium]